MLNTWGFCIFLYNFFFNFQYFAVINLVMLEFDRKWSLTYWGNDERNFEWFDFFFMYFGIFDDISSLFEVYTRYTFREILNNGKRLFILTFYRIQAQISLVCWNIKAFRSLFRLITKNRKKICSDETFYLESHKTKMKCNKMSSFTKALFPRVNPNTKRKTNFI